MEDKKPRIYPGPKSEVWICEGARCFVWGTSPVNAYAAWLESREHDLRKQILALGAETGTERFLRHMAGFMGLRVFRKEGPDF